MSLLWMHKNDLKSPAMIRQAIGGALYLGLMASGRFVSSGDDSIASEVNEAEMMSQCADLCEEYGIEFNEPSVGAYGAYTASTWTAFALAMYELACKLIKNT